jgi:RimJ/RimL family protein N-acetyltransferase
MITIRTTTPDDLPEVMQAYDYGRALMRAQGNVVQWVNGYPSEAFIRSEIAAGHSFVCTNERGELLGTFCFIKGDDPTYARIDAGAWLNDKPYGVVHRLATNGRERGVGKACLAWCVARCESLRIDTHHDNLSMRRLLEAAGFQRCGIIYVEDGTPRIAYQNR